MNDKVFVILASSAISFRNCLLGEGNTEKEAWIDAFGSLKKPKHAKTAFCKEVTLDELDELRDGIHH
jgi:hypothetical protein